MAVTQHHLFLQELETLLLAEIDRIKDEMSAGMLSTYEDYRHQAGKISGLRCCLDYMEEASSNVRKKLG